MTNNLTMNRQGFIEIENENYEGAKTAFEDYLQDHKTLCQTFDCGQEQRVGQWWGNHNLGLTNKKLNEFEFAEKKFIAALESLGYKDELDTTLESCIKNDDKNTCPKNNDTTQNSTINFSKISFNKTHQTGKTANENEIEQGINITLRTLAELYRDYATKTDLTNQAICKDSSDLSLNKGPKSLSTKEKCLNEKAYKIYDKLIPRITTEKTKAEIQKLFAGTSFDLKFFNTSETNYKKALAYYEKEKNTSQIIGLQSELLKIYLNKDRFDEANNLKDKIIKTKIESLEEKYKDDNKDSRFALIDVELGNTYSSLKDIYITKKNEIISSKSFEKKLSNLKYKYKEKPKIIAYLRRFDSSNKYERDISPPIDDDMQQVYVEAVEETDLKHIIIPLEIIKAFALNIIEINDEDSSIFYIYFSDLVDAYISDGQLCVAEFIIDHYLKKAEAKPKEYEGSLNILKSIFQIYLKYNQNDKAKFFFKKYVDKLGTFYAEEISPNLKDCSSSNLKINDYSEFNKHFLTIGEYLLYLGQYEKAEEFLIHSETMLKCIVKANEEANHQGFYLVNQIMLGRVFEKYKPLDAIINKYDNGIMLLDKLPAEDRTDREEFKKTIEEFKYFLQMRKVYVYLINEKYGEAEKLLCGKKTENKCTGIEEYVNSQEPQKMFEDVTPFPVSYIQAIDKIVNYYKKNKLNTKALRYSQVGVRILNSYQGSNKSKYTDFNSDFAIDGTKKYYEDYIRILETQKTLVSDKKKVQIDEQIKQLKDEQENIQTNKKLEWKCEKEVETDDSDDSN